MKVWLVGIKGAVATTTLVGILAIKRGLSSASGIPSEDEKFSRLNLARLEDIEFGGHDIRNVSLYEAMCQNVSENNTFDTTQLAKMKEENSSTAFRCGIVSNCGTCVTHRADGGEQTLRIATKHGS